MEMKPLAADENLIQAHDKPIGLFRRSFLASAVAGVAASAAAVTDASAADKFARDRDWTGNVPVTYPEPAFEVLDKRFTGRQGNATLQRIWHGQGHDAAL